MAEHITTMTKNVTTLRQLVAEAVLLALLRLIGEFGNFWTGLLISLLHLWII
jgi:hypothetical protein